MKMYIGAQKCEGCKQIYNPAASFTVLPFSKVALAFMWLAPSFESISHYTPCIDVTMRRQRDGRIYQGRFWATPRYTRSRSNRHDRNTRRAVFSVWSVPRYYKKGTRLELRRRRKEKSQIWDSKIWSVGPRDSDLRKTALARASSTYKRQTRSLIREGVPQ
jgi:hypothetical protein